VNNLRLLAIKKGSRVTTKLIRFRRHQQTQRLHQTASNSHRQSAVIDGRRNTDTLRMGYLRRMVVVVSYTNSQLSFLVVEGLWDAKFQRVQFRVWSSVLWHYVGSRLLKALPEKPTASVLLEMKVKRRPTSAESRKKIWKKRGIYPGM